MIRDVIRTLVLEDNVSDYELLKRELKKACLPCVIDWAQDRDDFMRVLGDGRPDLILLDYNLPGFSGLEALQLALNRYPDVPAIIVSGAIGEEVAIEALKAGATDYVLKQRLERLKPVIERAMDEADQQALRRVAEKELEETKGRLEAIVSQMPMGVFVIDTKTDTTVMVNDEARSLFRFEDIPIEDRHRLHHFVRMFDPDAGTPIPDTVFMEDAISQGRVVRGALKLVEHPDGSRFYASISIAPVRDKRENIIAVVVMIRDVTAQAEAEQKIKIQAELLERSNTDLKQFAYIASHDLKEPLRNITGHLEMVKRRLGNDLDPKTMEHMAFVMDGAERMRALIDDLLLYSRVDSRPVKFAEVDMNDVAAKVLAELRLAISDSKAVVEVRPLPVLKADEAQMGELLQNLVSNAIKFHGPDPPRVEIAATDDQKDWVLSVKDNGIGIDPKYADRIFQMFQRLVPKSYPGTGIGLAVCKRIVERHGGRIWVDSKVGQGSTFSFSIPKTPVAAPES
jgi:PAS domain S-box-containing protein